MRVIAGAFRGRRLKAPAWAGLRPTSDQLRETLFNVLAPRIAGARVLDGYAGTGAVGIEALSRGAAWVTFVDRDPRAAALIAANLAACGIEKGYAIIRADLARGLSPLREGPAAEWFDVVLLDPPYEPDSRAQLETILAAAGEVLKSNGVLVLEHARRHQAPDAVGHLVRFRHLASGDSALSFYEISRP
jgi:16S rRNA (guanine(966)-N(2))-methyltransferase RsmD